MNFKKLISSTTPASLFLGLTGRPNQGDSKPMGWVYDKYLYRSEK